MKVLIPCDICYAGMIEVEVDDLNEALDLAKRDSFSSEEIDFDVIDYDRKCLMIIPSGEILQ